jgi:CheY-like chemotaxis protein
MKVFLAGAKEYPDLMKTLQMTTPRILLVDDYAPLRNLLESVLREVGWEPTAVATGSEAIALLASEKFDLAVVDYSLPDVPGTEVGERSNLPVLYITGRVDQFAEAMNAGAMASGRSWRMLAKPFLASTFVAAVQNMLHEGKP